MSSQTEGFSPPAGRQSSPALGWFARLGRATSLIEKEILALRYQFGFLKIVPAERVFPFSIGKNSKIRVRRTEPRIDFKQDVKEWMHAEDLQKPLCSVLFNDS